MHDLLCPEPDQPLRPQGSLHCGSLACPSRQFSVTLHLVLDGAYPLADLLGLTRIALVYVHRESARTGQVRELARYIEKSASTFLHRGFVTCASRIQQIHRFASWPDCKTSSLSRACWFSLGTV